MADSIDSLMKEVSKLRKILLAQQSGLPERLSILVTGRDAASPEGVRRAVLNRLATYGLADSDDAAEAGCELTVIVLPWLTERDIGNRSSSLGEIQDASKTEQNSVQISVNHSKAFTGNDSFSLVTEESGKRDNLS